MPDYNSETRRLPRWLKIVGLTIAILAILGILMMVLLGGGEHGPGRHSGNHALLSSSPGFCNANEALSYGLVHVVPDERRGCARTQAAPGAPRQLHLIDEAK